MPEGRILIVEDDVELAVRLKDYFQARGYEVLIAHLGQEALSLARLWTPEIIIQDIRLPDMDGFEVARRLAESPRTRAVGIFFLTQLGDRESKLQGLKLGAVGYMAKPFDLDELELRVRNAIKALRRPRPLNPITGLFNRETLAIELSSLLQEGKWAAFRVLLDGIEEFMDYYGFVTADDLLRAVALVLKNLLAQTRAEGLAGHLGEADFLFLCPVEKAEEIESKLKETLARTIAAFYPAKEIAGERRPTITIKLGKAIIEEGKISLLEEVERATTPLESIDV
ncbi:MAG: response regulator [Anaerolineae bacterium]|nr:response regulator [Anaerolineae bacterium]MDW8102732.1 response regulator [Anaerolineae bacterium]